MPRKLTNALVDLARHLVVLPSSRHILECATKTHLLPWDRRLNGADCIVIVHARRASARAVTFDAHRDGLVRVM